MAGKQSGISDGPRATGKAADVPELSLRALGRATLARQMMLERAAVTPLTAIERLVGMQAQLPRAPYVALWSRLAGFRREALTELIMARDVVRATLMRATIHLVTVPDFLALRGLMQPMLTANARSAATSRGGKIDPQPAIARARAHFSAGSSSIEALRQVFRDEGADPDRAWAMTYHVHTDLPLVRVPDGSTWGHAGVAPFMPAEDWLGQPVPATGDIEPILLRYIGAYGPASVADAQAWSGLRNLKTTFERLRPHFVVFRDPDGRELFDLPDAPRPEPETPAPVRFLPDYDNIFLGLADRMRFIRPEQWDAIKTGNFVGVRPFMADGVIAGTWWTTRTKDAARLTVRPFATPDGDLRAALEAEAEGVLRFLEEDAATLAVDFETPWIVGRR